MASLSLNLLGTTYISGIINANLEKLEYLPLGVKPLRIFFKSTSPSVKFLRIVKDIKVLSSPISGRANGAMKEL